MSCGTPRPLFASEYFPLSIHDTSEVTLASSRCALRDAGFEVIYTGLRQTPEQIAAAAVQEDVRAVGLSILSGAHGSLLPEVVELLRGQDAHDILVFAGGIIPDQDIPPLKEAGVDAIFGPGSSTESIISYLNEALGEAASA